MKKLLCAAIAALLLLTCACEYSIVNDDPVVCTEIVRETDPVRGFALIDDENLYAEFAGISEFQDQFYISANVTNRTYKEIDLRSIYVALDSVVIPEAELLPSLFSMGFVDLDPAETKECNVVISKTVLDAIGVTSFRNLNIALKYTIDGTTHETGNLSVTINSDAEPAKLTMTSDPIFSGKTVDVYYCGAYDRTEKNGTDAIFAFVNKSDSDLRVNTSCMVGNTPYRDCGYLEDYLPAGFSGGKIVRLYNGAFMYDLQMTIQEGLKKLNVTFDVSDDMSGKPLEKVYVTPDQMKGPLMLENLLTPQELSSIFEHRLDQYDEALLQRFIEYYHITEANVYEMGVEYLLKDYEMLEGIMNVRDIFEEEPSDAVPNAPEQIAAIAFYVNTGTDTHSAYYDFDAMLRYRAENMDLFWDLRQIEPDALTESEGMAIRQQVISSGVLSWKAEAKPYTADDQTAMCIAIRFTDGSLFRFEATGSLTDDALPNYNAVQTALLGE